MNIIKIKCFKCKSEGLHTALWNLLQKTNQDSSKSDKNKDDSLSCLVKNNTSILLQTANAIATDENQNQCCAVKILLDPGSQQTFVTQRIVDELKLKL